MAYKVTYWDRDAGKQFTRDADAAETLEIDARIATAPAAQAEAARVAAVEDSIAADAVIASLKAMTNAEFDAYWVANVTTVAQASAVLKRLARVVIRRVL